MVPLRIISLHPSSTKSWTQLTSISPKAGWNAETRQRGFAFSRSRSASLHASILSLLLPSFTLAVHHRNRNRFLVNVHANILNVHTGAPFGRVLLHTQNLP